MKTKLEYVWLDGHEPEPNLRSKVKVVDNFAGTAPIWTFDGSSTQQAEGGSSDCLLQPVRVYTNPFEDGEAYFILCEVMSSTGTPHASNVRTTLINDEEWWFGFEQEYVLTNLETNMPVGFPENDFPRPQGEYYCGVGPNQVQGREIASRHLDACLYAGIDITGTNAEVMIGQWEYQCFGKGAQAAADDLWMSRYIMHRITEQYNVDFDLRPKPVKGDWNGTGMHTNFSTRQMRETGGEPYFTHLCKRLKLAHKEHMENYGSDNDQRLTGLHETQHIDQFTYGVSDRGASVRIPVNTVQDGWKGYLEDRRPASNADPYKIVRCIINTLS